MIEIIQDYDSCQYAEQSYFESDTGYSEYECEITGKECGELCPLCFKYSVTCDGNKL